MSRIGYQSKVQHATLGIGTVISMLPRLITARSGATSEVSPRQWRVRFLPGHQVIWVPEADLSPHLID